MDEQLRNALNASTINLAVITKNNIRELLTERLTIENSQLREAKEAPVYTRSDFKIWANCDLDSRYWLIEKDKNDNLRATRCLNYIESATRFGDICVDIAGGISWVVLFEENSQRNENLPRIDQDTMMIFCVLSEPRFKDRSHVGHFTAQPTESCRDLIERVKDTDEFQDCPYRVFLRTWSNESIELTDFDSSLEECGVLCGAVLDFQKQDTRHATSDAITVMPGNYLSAPTSTGDSESDDRAMCFYINDTGAIRKGPVDSELTGDQACANHTLIF